MNAPSANCSLPGTYTFTCLFVCRTAQEVLNQCPDLGGGMKGWEAIYCNFGANHFFSSDVWFMLFDIDTGEGLLGLKIINERITL